MKPFILWMTGLPCSGKTTIVKDLQKDIPNLAMLDGDELREWFSPKDFSKAGRDEHNKKVAHLAKLLLNHGVPSIVSLVSPYVENRENAREIISKEEEFEMYEQFKSVMTVSKKMEDMIKEIEYLENQDWVQK